MPRWKQLLIVLAFFISLILIWEAIYFAGIWSPVLVPSPRAVFRFLWKVLSDGLDGSRFLNSTLVGAMLVTIRRLITGYVLGILLGVPLGLFTARFRTCELTLGRVALGFQTLPSVCWVPLAILWFGLSEWAMLFVVIMGTVWSVLIATDSGVRTVPPIYIRAARTMGSKRFHTWLKVILPASLPFIVSGMKQGWAFAWRSLMAAEIFVPILTGFGLGQLLHYGRDMNDMTQVIGIILVIIAIGLIADKILFSPWEKFLHRRWGTQKE